MLFYSLVEKHILNNHFHEYIINYYCGMVQKVEGMVLGKVVWCWRAGQEGHPEEVSLKRRMKGSPGEKAASSIADVEISLCEFSVAERA